MEMEKIFTIFCRSIHALVMKTYGTNLCMYKHNSTAWSAVVAFNSVVRQAVWGTGGKSHVVSRAHVHVSHSSKYLYYRISGYRWILASTKCKDCKMENMAAMRNTINLWKHYLIKFI